MYQIIDCLVFMINENCPKTLRLKTKSFESFVKKLGLIIYHTVQVWKHM